MKEEKRDGCDPKNERVRKRLKRKKSEKAVRCGRVERVEEGDGAQAGD